MNVRPKQKTKLGCGNKQREKRKKEKNLDALLISRNFWE
jgi:hypothetical protein